jgi:hypothetical protein
MIPVFPNYVFINDSSLTRQIQDNIIRSDIEVGPQKTRPRQSKPMFNVSFLATICEGDFNNFLTWFRNNASYGSSWFLLKDPFDGVQKRFRFSNTQINFQKSNHIYQATFELESYDG